VTQRIPLSELEWRGKLVTSLDASEKDELIETLHTLLYQSALNFDQLQQKHEALMGRYRVLLAQQDLSRTTRH